jgi:UDP-N-acetylglucosamine 3-dehydrogenase
MKIGIVGMGSIGQRHAENARKLGHQVVSYDPQGSSDYRFERLLYDDPDVKAVVVATPSMWHEGPLRAAVERGKHVLVEKPISIGTGSLQAILSSAAYKDLIIMMGNNLRFHPAVLRAKQYVDSGLLGDLRWANFICATEWTSTAARDGVILNTGSHEVDIALYLFGPAVVLSAVVEKKAILRPGTADSDVNVFRTERSADFVLQHDNGVRSSFHIDIDTPHRVRQFWISGADGSRRFDLDRRTADEDFFGGDYATDYITEMQTFIARCQDADGTQGLPGASGEDGLDCLHLLLDIKKAAGL